MNKKPTVKFLIRLLFLMFIGGLIGGFSSMILGASKITLTEISEFLKLWLSQNASYASVLLLTVSCIAAWTLYFKSRKEYQEWDQEDSEYILKTQRRLDISISFVSVGTILGLIFFSISNTSFISTLEIDESISTKYHFIYVLVFIIATVLNILAERGAVNLTKAINPEKRGDVLDLNFQKKWLKSCDEHERQVIYKSAYKSYCATNYTFMGAFIGLMLISIFQDVGILPIMLTGIFWIVQSLSYTISSLKYSDTKKKSQQEQK